MQRSIETLGLNGFIINSHTNNQYLDDEKYWELFEAAEALDRPIYLLPPSTSDGMAEPFRDYQLGRSMWGYAIEAGTHAVRLICSGLFDRFPKLRIVLGHMGEAVPDWLWRLDFMHARRSSLGMVKKLQLKPSDYFKRNFAVTTSGVESHDVLRYVLDVLDTGDMMWAIDYPYQPTPPAVAFMDSAPTRSELPFITGTRSAFLGSSLPRFNVHFGWKADIGTCRNSICRQVAPHKRELMPSKAHHHHIEQGQEQQTHALGLCVSVQLIDDKHAKHGHRRGIGPELAHQESGDKGGLNNAVTE
jgi:hypothetical protein